MSTTSTGSQLSGKAYPNTGNFRPLYYTFATNLYPLPLELIPFDPPLSERFIWPCLFFPLVVMEFGSYGSWLSHLSDSGGHYYWFENNLSRFFETNSQSKYPIATPTRSCYGALHWAAHHGGLEQIKYLISAKANVNLLDNFR